MTSVSAGHIILTPTQPVGSGRPQRESNPGPPHQESRTLPTELPSPPPPPPPTNRARKEKPKRKQKKKKRKTREKNKSKDGKEAKSKKPKQAGPPFREQSTH